MRPHPPPTSFPPTAARSGPRRGARLLLAGALLAVAWAGGCQDNIGRVWDPDFFRGGRPGTEVRPAATGAIIRDGRPRVLAAAPRGSGVAVTTPVFLLFSESLNQDSVVRTGAGAAAEPNIRVLRTDQQMGVGPPGVPAPGPTPVAGTFDFLVGGRVVLFRPVASLPPAARFEVVVTTGVRDLDGIPVAREEVVTSFTTAAENAAVRPVVVAVFPVDRAEDEPREVPIYAVFNQQVDEATVGEESYFLRDLETGSLLPSEGSFPLRTPTQQADRRVARLDPDGVLPSASRIGVVLTTAIRAAGESLVVNRQPQAVFRTLPFLGPQDVAVGNPTPGFPHRVNLSNLGNLLLDVELPATALAGDRLLVRVYGGDLRATGQEEAFRFVEARQTLAADGPGTETVDLGAALGTTASPRLKDGEVFLVARLERGGRVGAFLRGAEETIQDTVRPELVALGPPVLAGSTTDFLTDLASASVHGQASERIGALELEVEGNTYGLFASSPDGRFVSRPLQLGRRTQPVSFSLLLTDRAGNPAAAAVLGTIRQRGAVTDSVAGGTLVVEVFDEATLRPLAGASVQVEEGMPSKPPAGRRTASTGSDGRAVFTGLSASFHSVTVAATGYHMASRLDTSAGFVGLGLRPVTGATATLAGTANYTPALGPSAFVGTNVLDAEGPDGRITIPTAGGTNLPPTAIRAGRPVLLSAFAGPASPTSVPTFLSYVCAICPPGGLAGATGDPLPPLAPAGGGETATAQLVLLPAAGTTANFLAPYTLSLASATGLDTANLAASPEVLIHATLAGFGRSLILGRGFATGSPSTDYSVNGTFSLLSVLTLDSLQPLLWSSTTVQDTSGNMARHRAPFVDNAAGWVVSVLPFPGIPTVTPPGSPSTGAPEVTFADRLDASTLAGSLAFHRLLVVGPGGRRWTLWLADTDGAGGTKTVQIPDLSGSAITGLPTGEWQVSADSLQVFAPVQGPHDLVLGELERFVLTHASAAQRAFTVQ